MGKSSEDLSGIRRELDPAFSYIIFEKQGTLQTRDDLDDLLSRLGIPVLQTTIHENRMKGTFFFVAKLDPEKACEISKEYVTVNLPENVTCLFYGSLV